MDACSARIAPCSTPHRRRATYGEEPLASKLKAKPDEPIRYFQEEEINVIVVGGGTNGYWQMMGAHHRTSINIDEWC